MEVCDETYAASLVTSNPLALATFRILSQWDLIWRLGDEAYAASLVTSNPLALATFRILSQCKLARESICPACPLVLAEYSAPGGV